MAFNISKKVFSGVNSIFKRFYEVKFTSIQKKDIYLKENNSQFDKFPELKEKIEQIEKKPYLMVNSAFDNHSQKYILDYLKVKNLEQQNFFK